MGLYTSTQTPGLLIQSPSPDVLSSGNAQQPSSLHASQPIKHLSQQGHPFDLQMSSCCFHARGILPWRSLMLIANALNGTGGQQKAESWCNSNRIRHKNTLPAILGILASQNALVLLRSTHDSGVMVADKGIFKGWTTSKRGERRSCMCFFNHLACKSQTVHVSCTRQTEHAAPTSFMALSSL